MIYDVVCLVGSRVLPYGCPKREVHRTRPRPVPRAPRGAVPVETLEGTMRSARPRAGASAVCTFSTLCDPPSQFPAKGAVRRARHHVTCGLTSEWEC